VPVALRPRRGGGSVGNDGGSTRCAVDTPTLRSWAILSMPMPAFKRSLTARSGCPLTFWAAERGLPATLARARSALILAWIIGRSNLAKTPSMLNLARPADVAASCLWPSAACCGHTGRGSRQSTLAGSWEWGGRDEIVTDSQDSICSWTDT